MPMPTKVQSRCFVHMPRAPPRRRYVVHPAVVTRPAPYEGEAGVGASTSCRATCVVHTLISTDHCDQCELAKDILVDEVDLFSLDEAFGDEAVDRLGRRWSSPQRWGVCEIRAQRPEVELRRDWDGHDQGWKPVLGRSSDESSRSIGSTWARRRRLRAEVESSAHHPTVT